LGKFTKLPAVPAKPDEQRNANNKTKIAVLPLIAFSIFTNPPFIQQLDLPVCRIYLFNNFNTYTVFITLPKIL